MADHSNAFECLFLGPVEASTRVPVESKRNVQSHQWSALASHGIGLLQLNVCASILLIPSCFDHVRPTVLG